MKEKDKLLPLLIFTAVSLIYCFPIFKNITYWGQMDWDQFTFWHAVPRKTILAYHQFPLWNPYSSGGNVMLAHPHSSFLSPFYLLVLFFGPVFGIKLEIVIFLVIGLLGMFFLLKHLGLKEMASYAGAFIFMLSSIYPLHLTEGHVEWLAMVFVPWLFLFYLKSIVNRKYRYGGIVFIAIMVFGGSVDILAIMVLFLIFFSFIMMLKEKRIIWLKNIAIIFAGAFLLSSIKLFPMFEFLSYSPRIVESPENISPLLLPAILLDRNHGGLYAKTKWNDPDKKAFISPHLEIDYGWHEYGAYVGIAPLLLFVVGVFSGFKKQWPLFLVGIIFLMLSLGGGSPINLWKTVRFLPIYNSLHVPSRLILGFMLVLSVFAGLALSRLEGIINGRIIAFLIILFILFDLNLVNSSILRQAFVIPPMRVKEHIDFHQRHNHVNFYPGFSRSSMYPVFLSNSGVLEAYEVINVEEGKIFAVDDAEYKGEVYLANDRGSARIVYFSPNKIIVNVNVEDKDMLVLNQNYYKGWRVKGKRSMDVVSFNGLIATSVDSLDKTIIFYYQPDSFVIGCIVSGISLLAGLGFMRNGTKNKA